MTVYRHSSKTRQYLLFVLIMATLMCCVGLISRLPSKRFVSPAGTIGITRGRVASRAIVGDLLHRFNTRLFSIKRKDRKPEEWKLRQLRRRREKEEKVATNKQDLVIDSVLHGFRGNSDELLIQGTVIERRGDRVLVETSNTSSLHRLGDAVATISNENDFGYLVASQRAFLSNTKIVVGDVVHVNITNKDQPVVVGLNERLNLLERALSGRGTNKLVTKSIASNIDQLLIVVSIRPQVPTGMIDRFIVAAIKYGIPEVSIVVNKADLEGTYEYFRFLEYYQTLGYKVIQTSSTSTEGLTDLFELLKGKTSVFVGQSGVGKSSLIKAVIPEVKIAIGDLGGVGKNVGAHTTSNARLYHIEDKSNPDVSNDGRESIGKIIDSPGIRELGVWHLDRESIRKGFIEIDEYAKHCKFRNCQHTEKEGGEKGGCAVRKAMHEGNIHFLRLDSYLDLLR